MSDIFDDLFQPAKSEFPAKEDLKDRLVVIFPTGKSGERKSQATGKTYPYVETVTVVLDDGPDGVTYTDLVPLVNDSDPGKPIVLRNFQWSAAGIYSRVSSKQSDPAVPGTVGRINSMKNKIKGMADAWSIATPTEEDMVTARKYTAVVAEIRAELRKARQSDADENAFG